MEALLFSCENTYCCLNADLIPEKLRKLNQKCDLESVPL